MILSAEELKSFMAWLERMGNKKAIAHIIPLEVRKSSETVLPG
jgi:hypothetical protein